MKVKVGLCVGVKGDPIIARLKEFIEHYINIGFNKIFLYDNNETNGPNPLDVLQDYLEYIEYHDIRGNHSKDRQWASYTECYYDHFQDFDFILFADDDEYLILKEDKTIQEYLSRDIFKDADCIHVNWKIFNSGDILFEDPNTPLIEQYTTFIPTTLCNYPNIPEDNHIKTIVKCCGKKIYFHHPHFASCIGSPLKCVTASGNPCVSEYPFSPFDESLAVLNHYQARAVDVFCYKRLGGRSTRMFDDYPYIPEKEIERYFKYNERTPERENYIAKFLKNN